MVQELRDRKADDFPETNLRILKLVNDCVNSIFQDRVTDIPDLEQGAAFISVDREILTATENGDISMLKHLISAGADIQEVDELGRNALHYAIVSGQDESFEFLLNAGVNPVHKDNMGMTPLSLILIMRPSFKLIRQLFEYGAIVLPRKSSADIGIFIRYTMVCDTTPEAKEIMELLLKNGCLINDPVAPGGRQALHLAAMADDSKLIEILVSLGADLFAKNHRGQTARQVAWCFDCKEAEHTLSLLEEGHHENIMLSSEQPYIPTEEADSSWPDLDLGNRK